MINDNDKIMIKSNQKIDRVKIFILLGIVMNEKLDWKPHINRIAIKISKSVGILNKLKNFIPPKIRLIIYHSLIASHFNYGILVWGFQCQNLFILQKKAVRHIS